MLGWGLIGASAIAREYMLPAINAQPDSEGLAVTSNDRCRAQSRASTLGIPRATGTLADLLSDPDFDAVSVSTTNEHHARQTIAADAGKRVQREKPLAMALPAVRAMIDTCQRARAKLGRNLHLRNGVTRRGVRQLVRNDPTLPQTWAAS